MNKQKNSASNDLKEMFDNPLASITNTLVEASRRRNLELRKRMAPKLEGYIPHTSPVSMLRQTDGAACATNPHESTSLPQSPPATVQINSTCSAQYENGGNSNVDLAQILAEFNNAPKRRLNGIGEDEENIDPKQLLEQFENIHSARNEAPVSYDSSDDPKVMLAELARNRLFFGETSRGKDLTEDGDDDLETLSGKLANMLSDKAIHRLSAPNPMTDKLKVDTENGKQEISPERNGILHVIASKSEMGGCKREEVRASDSPGGCVEIEEKKEAWDQAERNLEELIQQVIHEENSYQRARLPCRLLVLNIAAGAKERDLYEFFYRFRSSVRNIKILPSRDPISRTQIAHVDMSTRSIALEASYMTNNIFGLIPKIKLAVETGD